MFQPLQGLRVVDLSQVLAGPYTTYILALMGAEVIKIEKPGEGDWTRNGGPVAELAEQKMSVAFLTQNAGKKSVTLDLKSPEGLAIAKDLVAGADIFVENFKPGVAARLGLGFDALKAVNPRIVYCSISAYGQTGPLSPRPAYDHVIQGMCGIMMTTGKPGDGPTKVGAPYIDYATGMNGALAVLAGLREMERTGQAVEVDIAMLDTALMLMASLMTSHLTGGWQPAQSGNEAWSASPSSGAFETRDGTLMLAANHDAQFRKLCAAIGRDDILRDPRWGEPARRAHNAPALRETLNQTFLTRTAAEWETLLAQAAVPAARVRGLDEVLAEAQVRDRGLLSEMRLDGVDTPVHLPNLPFLGNGSVSAPASAPARLGADTRAILRELGYCDDKIEALRKTKVI